MKDKTPADAAAPQARKGRHLFIVNAGRDMLEFEMECDDFEVTADGVHFIRDQDKETEHVHAFASHPCLVRMDDDGQHAATRPAAQS